MLRFALPILLLFTPCSLFGADLFVSPDGNDTGPGSLEKPFRTVQQGVDALKPGDTCYVREGVYRESTTFNNSGIEDQPIRLRAYPGERVVLDGTEPIPGPWTKGADGVVSAPTSMKIEQLFAGEAVLTEARWPNCTPDKMLTREGWAPTGPKSAYGSIHSPELARTGIDWNGAMAMLNVAHQFWSWSRTVKGYTPGSDQLPYTISMNPFHYENRNWWDDDFFYLVRKREALDAEGEWVVENGSLFVIPPGGKDPSTLNVRAKQRDYAIQGNGLKFVEIAGLHFFGCTFQLTDCEDCLVEYCNLLYPSYARGVPNAEEKGQVRPCPGTMVSGSRNTIRSCSFEHCPNYGVVLQGDRNVIENSIVHDVNWAGTLHYTAVALRGGKGIERPKNIARHNTLYNVGNSIVTCSGPDSIVEYNHVHHGGLISADVSLIYTSMPSADGLEFRYNWVHDSLSPNHSLGIRGDDKTRGLRVHHNVLWNIAKDGIVTKGGRNRVYNNTCFANGAADIMFNSGPERDKWWQEHVKAYQNQNEDSLLVNNCARAIVSTRRRVQPPLPGDNSNNYTDGDPLLVAPAQFDFRPLPGSPLVDAGRAVDGITAPYEGAAPDIGAYEHGGEYWLPGHRNGVWLAGKAGQFAVRLNLPILEPVDIRVVQGEKQIGTLTFTPENWGQFQNLPVAASGEVVLAFETKEWGLATIAESAIALGPIDARATFDRADIASARGVDSRPKFEYEYRYDVEPVVLPAWRAFFTEKTPTVDGVIGKGEWPGWDRARTIPLISLADDASDILPAGEVCALLDETDLYLGARVISNAQSVEATDSSDFIEIDLARVFGKRVDAPFVLRGYPDGRLENATKSDVEAKLAQRFATRAAFAARSFSNGRWNCEFRIPLSAIDVDTDAACELRFNIGLRHVGSRGGPWFAAARPADSKQAFAKAGSLHLDRSVRADAANLVTNGSFESDDLQPWRLASNSRDPLPEDTIKCVRQGLYQDGCIRMHADNTEAMKKRVIKWTYPTAKLMTAPGWYCLSYQVRVLGAGLVPHTDMGSFNSYVRVQQGSSGGNMGQQASALTTTGDCWIRRDQIVKVPEGATASMISLQLHQATGTVLVDDVSLIRCQE